MPLPYLMPGALLATDSKSVTMNLGPIVVAQATSFIYLTSPGIPWGLQPLGGLAGSSLVLVPRELLCSPVTEPLLPAR